MADSVATGHGQTAGSYGIGPGMMGYSYGNTPAARSSSGDSPTGAIIATAALAALLVGGALALALPRLRRHSHGATPATS